jgi:hypothetical protein
MSLALVVVVVIARCCCGCCCCSFKVGVAVVVRSKLTGSALISWVISRISTDQPDQY